MPPRRRRLTVLAAVLALAAAGPALPSALAQSAGDEQYQDPFAGEDQGQSQGGGDEQAEPTPAPAPAEPEQPAQPAQPAPEPAAGEPTPAAPAAQPASQATELPRTGLDAAPVLAIGAVLLAGGVALRLRLRERR